MARVTNDACVQAWLRDQPTHSTSMRSEPPHIYSYRMPIACKHPQGVLIVPHEGLTMTSLLHCYRVIDALNGAAHWRVPNIDEPHAPENVSEFLAHIVRAERAAEKARTYTGSWLNARGRYITELGDFCNAFGLARPTIPPMSDKLIAKVALRKLRGEPV